MLETTTASPKPMDRVLGRAISVNWELVGWLILIVLAVVSRTYHLGDRGMSHDESLHTFYSWKLFAEGDYRHDPMMHGPLLFHMTALSYFLFGVSDFTARLLFGAFVGVLLVLSPFLLRKWLGPVGALAASTMLLVSSTVMYYSRYVRHDIAVELFTVLMFVAFVRFLDDRRPRWVYLGFAAGALAITTAEMSYLNGFLLVCLVLTCLLTERLSKKGASYVAGAFMIGGMGLLAFSILAKMEVFGDLSAKGPIYYGKQIGYLFGGLGMFYGLAVLLLNQARPVPPAAALDADPDADPEAPDEGGPLTLADLVLTRANLAVMGGGVLVAVAGQLARSSGKLIVNLPNGVPVNLGSMLLVLGGFVAVYGLLGWILEHAQDRPVARRVAEVPVGTLGAAVAAALAIYVLFFTTFFTYPDGIGGFAASIKYWIEQHDVIRGGQPWYYYLMIGPMYEFLPWFVAVAALLVYARRVDLRFGRGNDSGDFLAPSPAAWVFVPGLIAWGAGSLWMFSWAGEKMPWLTVHPTVPFAILAGRLIADAVDATDWELVRTRNWRVAGLGLLCAILFLVLLAQIPFGGDTAGDLVATTNWIFGLAIFLGLVAALWRAVRSVPGQQVRLVLALTFAAVLFLLNTHYSLQANFVNDELATEYIVYAHGTPDDKYVYNQLVDMQKRIGIEKPLQLGYDNEVSWPFTWYFRTPDFPGQRYLGEKPASAADLKNLDAALIGEPNYGKFDPYLRNDFVSTEFRRMWWPNEGYKDLTLEKVWEDITDPKLRQNWINILLFRRYTADPLADNPQPKSLTDWYHRANMRLYVRKDLVNKLWPEVQARPDWLNKEASADTAAAAAPSVGLKSVLVFDKGPDGGPVLEPKDIALDKDGHLWVVDQGNKRVLGFDPTGTATVELAAGQLVSQDAAPQNSAWGVGVGADGAVYVADTWNHRILKFVGGKQVASWGVFGTPATTGEELDKLYGPRDVAVGPDGNVYVTDTGNKRIVVYAPDGKPIRAFGGTGLEPGQYNEPTSLAFDPANGDIYVADLWNLRIQRFDKDFLPLGQWTVEGWASQDASDKAYITVGPGSTVIATDPSIQRVWIFDKNGKTLGTLDLPNDERGLDKPIGVAADAEGGLYVASSNSGIVTHYAPIDAIRKAAGLDVADAGAKEGDGAAEGAGAAGDAGAASGESGAAGDGSPTAAISPTPPPTASPVAPTDSGIPTLPNEPTGGPTQPREKPTGGAPAPPKP